MSGKILVVEDNQINQKVIYWQLERLGLSCDIFPAGAAALKAEAGVLENLLKVWMPANTQQDWTGSARLSQ
jgi:CheY-like chemotaxis protein